MVPLEGARRTRFQQIVLAAIPAIALTFCVPLANHTEPRILGLPFLLAYIVVWIILTPVFLYAVYRLEPRT
jgi:hypothetical protein